PRDAADATSCSSRRHPARCRARSRSPSAQRPSRRPWDRQDTASGCDGERAIVPRTRTVNRPRPVAQSAGICGPPPAAEPRVRRRTVLTSPLPPPPQTNRSPPSDSGPKRPLRAASRASRGPLPLRIDSPQIALVTFPGAVPQLSGDPGDPGDEAVRLDRAKNRPRLGIDLIDLSAPMLPNPERPFGPRESGVTAPARRRDRGEHSAGLRVDLLDAIAGELKQVPAVEGRSGMGAADLDRAQRLAARRIEGDQPVSSGQPDVLTVIRDSMHVVDTREGSILSNDLGG